MFKRLIEILTGKPKPKSDETKIYAPQSTQHREKKGKRSVSARILLKEATQLKKEKKFDDACKKLEMAYSAPDAAELMIEERLRLPMYLQLSGKNDEGWKILNQLNIKYTDVFSQAEIADQMRIFLQREKKFKQAILFGAWTICKEVERDRSNLKGCIEMADDMATINREYYKFLPSIVTTSKVIGTTPKGNPITDNTYSLFNNRIDESISIEGVEFQLSASMKKAKLEDKSKKLAMAVSKYLLSFEKYDLSELRNRISAIIG